MEEITMNLFEMKRNYIPDQYPLLGEKQTQWFRDAKFGLFIHWGLYSLLGKGEWEMFNHRHSVEEYAELANGFTGDQFNPHQWARMAKDAGMTPAQLCQIERERVSPTLKTLERIATALGMTVVELLGGKGAESDKEKTVPRMTLPDDYITLRVREPDAAKARIWCDNGAPLPRRNGETRKKER